MYFISKIRKGNKILTKMLYNLIRNENTNLGIFFKMKGYPLEPLLFAYFNQAPFAPSLEQLLSFIVSHESESFSAFSDDKGIIHLPHIGYANLECSNKIFQITIKDGAFLCEEKAIRFTPETYIYNRIAISLFDHIYFQFFFSRISKNKIFAQPTQQQLMSVAKAMNLIRRIQIKEYEQIMLCCKRIVFFDSPNSNGFSAIDIQGAIFLNIHLCDNLIGLIENIVHESSHIALNVMLLDLENNFTIPAFKLNFHSPLREGKRAIYHVLHSSYVLGKLAIFFEQFLFNIDILDTKNEQLEVLGRFALIISRLEEGLGYINNDCYFKNDALDIYKKIEKTLVHIQKQKYYSELSLLDVKGQGLVFDLNLFLDKNPTLSFHEYIRFFI